MTLKDKFYFYIYYLKMIISDLFDKINEGTIAILVTILTGILLYFSYSVGDANLQELSNRGLKLSIFTIYSLGILKYQGTRKFDSWKEIIENKNLAYALVISVIIAGGALCLFL